MDLFAPKHLLLILLIVLLVFGGKKLRTLGSDLELGDAALPAGVGADWHERYWHARASMIYAGTNEIQRNLIAERLLGLPKAAR